MAINGEIHLDGDILDPTDILMHSMSRFHVFSVWNDEVAMFVKLRGDRKPVLYRSIEDIISSGFKCRSHVYHISIDESHPWQLLNTVYQLENT